MKKPGEIVLKVLVRDANSHTKKTWWVSIRRHKDEFFVEGSDAILGCQKDASLTEFVAMMYARSAGDQPVAKSRQVDAAFAEAIWTWLREEWSWKAKS